MKMRASSDIFWAAAGERRSLSSRSYTSGPIFILLVSFLGTLRSLLPTRPTRYTSGHLESENFVDCPCKRHHRSTLVFSPSALQAGGHRFDPGHVHQSFQSFVAISAEHLLARQTFSMSFQNPGFGFLCLLVNRPWLRTNSD
jgi:hypothetical protein